jgi:hypothetical protein
MKTLVAFLICFAAISPALAGPETMMGVWKLNESKSTFAPGSTKFTTVTYSKEGKQVRILAEGKDKDGKPARAVWTGDFDDRDYLVSLDPNQDTRSYKQIDPNTLEFVTKKESQVVATGRVVFSPDGKSRTVTTTMTDASGKKTENTAVYEKL